MSKLPTLTHQSFLDLIWESVSKHKVILNEGPEYLPNKTPLIVIGENECYYSDFPVKNHGLYIYEENGYLLFHQCDSDDNCYLIRIFIEDATPDMVHDILKDIYYDFNKKVTHKNEILTKTKL